MDVVLTAMFEACGLIVAATFSNRAGGICSPTSTELYMSQVSSADFDLRFEVIQVGKLVLNVTKFRLHTARQKQSPLSISN